MLRCGSAWGSTKVCSTPSLSATNVTEGSAGSRYPAGGSVSVMTHDVPSGAWMAICPSAPVVTSWVMTPPDVEAWLTPSMMVSGMLAWVVGRVQTMWNLAPASGSPSAFFLKTEMLPPTMKQAGPALRLLAGEADG